MVSSLERKESGEQRGARLASDRARQYGLQGCRGDPSVDTVLGIQGFRRGHGAEALAYMGIWTNEVGESKL